MNWGFICRKSLPLCTPTPSLHSEYSREPQTGYIPLEMRIAKMFKVGTLILLNDGSGSEVAVYLKLQAVTT